MIKKLILQLIKFRRFAIDLLGCLQLKTLIQRYLST